MKDGRYLVLSLLLSGPGMHIAAWRHPKAQAGKDLDFDHYRSMVQAAEREKYDMVFVGDSLLMNLQGQEAGKRWPRLPMLDFEPLTFLAGLAAATERIGLAATASTTYSDPFSVARAFASLDHISGGRAAWNVVTSQSDLEAANFGRDHHLDHADRYERCADFLEVAKRLWDSWEDDAIVTDRSNGIAFDPAKIHPINYRSAFFRVAGPLNISRCPQGHPVIIQAGASVAGQALAAATADIVFTAQPDIGAARQFYAGLKRQVAACGRRPEDLKILPGVVPVAGRTDAEAEAKYKELQDLIDPEVGLAHLSRLLGYADLSGVDLDRPLPSFDLGDASHSRREILRRMSEEEGLTVRQLYTKMAGAHGHFVVVGSAERVADELARWLEEEAADGFNLMPAISPGGFDDFNELVLPILRARGVTRDAYRGRTLREHLGIARPAAAPRGEEVQAAE